MAQRIQSKKAICHTGISSYKKNYHQKVLGYSLKQNSRTGTGDTKGATATLP